MKIKTKLIEAHIIRWNDSKLEYLLLKRASNEKYPNIWQMVTGKTRENENAYDTVLREIKEETNLKVEKLFIVPTVNSFYDSDDNSVNFVPVFVALVNPNSIVKLSDEHEEFEWVSKKITKKRLAWPGQYEAVKIIYNHFIKKKENLNFIEINI